MKSPRPDSPIPTLPSIRTIRVESARSRDAPAPTTVRHHSASVRRDSAILHSGYPPVYPSTSSALDSQDLSFPFPQRVSLKPLVHNNQLIHHGGPSLRPAVLPPFRDDALTRGPVTFPAEQTSSSPSPAGEEEEDDAGSHVTEIATISATISEPLDPPDSERPISGLFIRPEISSRVSSIPESSRMQGWKCEKDFEKEETTNKMKIWPQVLVSVVVALAHLALGTVLAYPAISLPLLLSSSTSTTTHDPEIPVSCSSDNESTYDLPSADEMFPSKDSSKWKGGGTSRSSTFSQILLENITEAVTNFTVTEAPPSSSSFFPVISIMPNQAAWLASIHTVGAIFGSMLCGTLLAVFGQRRTILLMAPIVLTSWLTIWAAPSLIFLIAARMTAGVCIGILGTGAQVYIVEISHESVRGSLTIITDLYVGIGLLLTYGLGALGLGWRWAAFILGLTTTIPLATGLIFFPDSPRWLAMKGRKEEAKKALRFLRGHTCDITNELETIQKVCSNRTQATTGEQLSMLKNPAVYTPFLTSCGVFTFSQFSGPYVVYSYTVYIFEVANVGFSPYISTVIVGVARVIGSFIGIVVVERAGRRLPMMVGGMGLALSLMALGAYFYLKGKNPVAASEMGWLPLTSMIIYTVALGATISPIPFLLSTELQPLAFRSMGSSASKGVFFVSGMLVTYSFPTLKSSLGPAVTFWMYSFSALTLVLFVGWVVPETKGRTLEEIEEYYNNRNAVK